MPGRTILSYLELRLLVALADNKGHPSWELEYMILNDDRDLSKPLSIKDRKNWSKTITMIDQGVKHGNLRMFRNEIDEKFSRAKKGVASKGRMTKKLDQSQLSRLINKLESEGWIYRKPRDKLCDPVASGPKTEEPLYIVPEKYGLINQLIREKLIHYRKLLKVMEYEAYTRMMVTYLDGTSKTVLIPSNMVATSTDKYKKYRSYYSQYVWLYWRWRARVRNLENPSLI
jgi:hypothetical protein